MIPKSNHKPQQDTMPSISIAAISRRGWQAALRQYALNNNRLHTTKAAAAATSFDNVFYCNANSYDVCSLTHHHRSINTITTQQSTQVRYFSSPSPSPSSPPSHSDSSITTNFTTAGGDESSKKSIFNKLWDKYSFEGQKKRIILGERLFRAAQYRANDPRWFTEARIPYEFRPRHALLTMHVWFLHKRLLADRVDSHLALLVQEELFDILWNDTRARIRAEGVNELTVNKHLKDAQQLTFLQCTHYDHSFQEFANDDKKRFEEIAGVNWTYVLNKDEEAYNDLVKRLTMYVEYQNINLLNGVPDDYFWEARIPWGDMPDFTNMKDNDGNELEEVEVIPGLEILPNPWMKTLTDAGHPYYWNTDTNETMWKRPSKLV